MYFGTRHTATRTFEDKRTYSCKACGFKSDAVVLGVGRGEGKSPYFLDESGASGRAAENAHYAAVANIGLTLRLCPCPRCGARDGASFVVRSVILTTLTVLVVWVVGWVFGTVFVHPPDLAFAAWIFGPLGVVCAVIYYFVSVRWKWTTAAARVRFLGAAGEVARKRAARGQGA